MKVNGLSHSLNVPANAILLDVLHERLQLTGSKKNCDYGQCGECTLLVNGVAINACPSNAQQHDGDNIITIEGLSRGADGCVEGDYCYRPTIFMAASGNRSPCT